MDVELAPTGTTEVDITTRVAESDDHALTYPRAVTAIAARKTIRPSVMAWRREVTKADIHASQVSNQENRLNTIGTRPKDGGIDSYTQYLQLCWEVKIGNTDRKGWAPAPKNVRDPQSAVCTA